MSKENENKLIAEFMQIPKCDRCGDLDCGQYKFGVGNYWHPKYMQYSRSWDWLMPVVEKIETMDYGFKICRKVVEIYIDSTKEVIIKKKESCKIDSLYKAVIEFINFYNAK